MAGTFLCPGTVSNPTGHTAPQRCTEMHFGQFSVRINTPVHLVVPSYLLPDIVEQCAK